MQKQILTSQKRNMYILSRCKVLVKNGQVCHLHEDGNVYTVPYANTVFIGLAEGTSITNEAMSMLAANGVIVFWTKGGGYDMFAADIICHLPQADYRPTKYMQNWVRLWLDEEKKLSAAKEILKMRVDSLSTHVHDFGVDVENKRVSSIVNKFDKGVTQATSFESLLGHEGTFVKSLYKEYALEYEIEFKRDHKSADNYNKFLTLGNYYAYGIARSSLWALGIDNSFPLLHGSTRRGGLVFDVADIIKTSIILPLAFHAADQGMSNTEFKRSCVAYFDKNDILAYLINNIKRLCMENSDVHQD
ncbi:CRISPR-associated protein [Vibrio phage JSF13]|jgi:CRISPR-associated protein Cas1|uniref:Uncharacterized protein n=5 Tax=unclassified Mohonavirus TaxID=3099903 RepID=A0ACD6B8J2_9CAUD|nr:hypothetical protein TUST1-15_00465 [Vibrio phage ICP1_2005_A]ADX89504.1 hypothetical protein TUST1-10_00460 [Vibrio phage ICP1_2004_A]AGG09389.1 Cas1 [Vibrio phage ICP1_2011_A]ASV42301.1 CRISPR-associated protein [Vibrio phage JSF13]ASV42353.1 CRISPR-associated protein [Vibrio phage JSF14]ASV42568.1 CRISPR-associated protein [Vibrio phage JSF17]AXY82404.1 Cas1 [Vibrio phage ICP1_2011_B]QFR59150.1 Cas1 [Vibrio phage ICP1_2017_F_Mathbaria]QVV97035.1 type I-F CRISPR-associated protein [Vib